MKQAILFIQIAESSFDESLFVARMVHQLSAETEVLCLANGISSALLSSNPDAIVGVLTENQEDNQQRFLALLERVRPTAIVLLDLYKFFLNPLELNFLPVWLEDLKLPIFALDYFNLMKIDEGKTSLQSGVQLSHIEAGEGAEALELPLYLIKPVPPVLPEAAERSFYWNPQDPSLASVAPELRQQVLASLNAPEETTVITVLFDPSLFSQAIERNLAGYYFVLIEVLIFYIRQFSSRRFQLLVMGSAPPTDQLNPTTDQHFEVHYFSHITEDNYRALLAASDLLISNTNWSPALLDAASLGLPVFVMGNSIIQEWKDGAEKEREMRSFFRPAPELYRLCKLMAELNQWSLSLPIFSFINYPFVHNDPDFPNPGLQSHALPHFLLDLFDDETSLPLFEELLFSPENRAEYHEYCEQMLAIGESALSFQQILSKVIPGL